MKLNGLGGLPFEVRPGTGPGAACLQLRIGPLSFTMTEGEALTLANRIADSVEHLRRSREERAR